MLLEPKERLKISCQLMDDFAQRTGLSGNGGNLQQRYLWTDAFAVQTFFNLAHSTQNHQYYLLANRLIDAVHHTLGRFQVTEERKGWISGLSEEEGENHPTINGLRIGKKLPERKPGEPFNERLEWERDGQYFHYLTRWMQALLQAWKETGETNYLKWAEELFLASEKFIYKTNGRLRMYWKMSTSLDRPLVSSMGAHDPLEGLICGLSLPVDELQKPNEVESLIQKFKDCCNGLSWSTSDSLGIGGLLLNVARVYELKQKSRNLPDLVQPERLLKDCLFGLEEYSQMHQPELSAKYRLAFRECGLSLGLRVIMCLEKDLSANQFDLNAINKYAYLADEIETFWVQPKNQSSTTWTEHLDINAVTLAASLAA